ncbi:Uncharacterised protein [Mycobacterium tuberculosis]|uniref:Uncharacterized protein n=1 Tax=Mycobacterium tuberculosis TaxID=1773 RepID=A0A655EIL7_MYCTX|nr:Uncharacterised protein [Mycobacterium tuberculosis]CFR68431.1 Uncharacterised protein [Mycobacterium tuberculosis]CKR75010.1 Uncharacterised protein [Mycobacterium tuberculosis]CKR87240.1 Uncharacterised protein [Mycobacterium tuberculosis]CKT02437.1 Uncharacterised protein [Mycobacterium tuberculosis]
MGVVKKLDRVYFSCVDALEIDPDKLLEATRSGYRIGHTVIATKVEVVEPVGAALVAGGDLVELVFHRRGEVVVDEPTEMLLEQTGYRERHP